MIGSEPEADALQRGRDDAEDDDPGRDLRPERRNLVECSELLARRDRLGDVEVLGHRVWLRRPIIARVVASGQPEVTALHIDPGWD